jgi:predicted RNA binding protein YcfA (HicA-like mRNA interferase family)
MDALRRRKASVRASELHQLLIDAGFVHTSGKGDHWRYKHPAWLGRVTIDPRKPHPLVAYVVKALAALEEVLGEED